MNICLLNDSFPPVIDGVANTVVNYGRIIQQNYGGACVVTPQYPGACDNYNFDVLRYASLDTEKLFGYRAGYPFDSKVLLELDKKGIQLLHSHCPFVSTLMGRTLRETFSVPLITTYHTKFDIDIANAIDSEALRATALKFLATNLEACDEVWAVSRGAGDSLRKIGYTGDYIIMENGVDLPRERVAQKAVDAVSNAHLLSDGAPVFLFVGRLMWYKGVRIILDGLAKLKARGHKFHMIFIGSGGDMDEIVAYTDKLGLSGSVIFTGPVHDREKLRAYYCRADLLTFPSTFDTNGLVVREAAACSLPSLLVKGSCAAEGIVDMETGLLIDEDSPSFAAKIERVLETPELLKRIGENAAKEIYVSWDDAVKLAYERYSVVYETFMRRQGKHIRVNGDELLSLVASINEQTVRLQTDLEHAVATNNIKLKKAPRVAKEYLQKPKKRVKAKVLKGARAMEEKVKYLNDVWEHQNLIESRADTMLTAQTLIRDLKNKGKKK